MNFNIHHFHIDHNAPCLPPKFWKSIALDFSWDVCNTQEKLETMVSLNFYGGGGGEGRVNKVHYSLCESSEYRK